MSSASYLSLELKRTFISFNEAISCFIYVLQSLNRFLMLTHSLMFAILTLRSDADLRSAEWLRFSYMLSP